jgi:hypothetical protein
LLPVKFVERKPSHSLGNATNNTKLDKTGSRTPINLIMLFKKSIFTFLFSISKCRINRNGTNKRDVGFIIMLIPRITLPINCQELFLYEMNINNEIKMKIVTNRFI